MSSCSKAPRGLFVLSRVTRIFTGTSISPGPSSRQRPDRYAFRAGRNLPDKEFRYLRTVIVTAAVYRGFGSKLSPLPLTFRHWAGISPYTSSLEFAGTCVFVKQSPGPFHCDPPFSGCSFSLSYGAILPSSLTKGIPFTLVYSTCPPVSVCGTVSVYSRLAAFLGGLGVWPSCTLSQEYSPLPPRLTLNGFAYSTPWVGLDGTAPLSLPCRVPASLKRAHPGTGISTCCPSAHTLLRVPP